MLPFSALVLNILVALAGTSGAVESPHITVPDGYVLQRLEPIGGEVAMPKGWFYSGGCTHKGCLWKLAKEDSTKGHYLTGLSIQMILGAEAAGIGKMNLINNYIAEKRQTAEVISECEATDIGDLTRVCLETIDAGRGPERFHVRYTFNAARSWDMVAVLVFGAPVGEWTTAAPIADVMSNVMLIGEHPAP